MTKDQSIPATTELSDDDLDQVQGAGNRMQQASAKGIVLSSESEEPTFKRDRKGIIMSSESEEPSFRKSEKGIVAQTGTGEI
ncbi:hypothetical protein KUL25_08600 [Rhodobacteraceae bacterium N5(2021)]|uniref:Uncharacterized protein n=1 Tax=Gymnodinialimonas phycosphaerae TaxID=2841589 RepID=A0A975TXT3_9RHOB|nr:hypothetical protein [Gymnodinialimonas phycosphaerae]MBY4892822.1 hypothetical protein [Gymnodinialimonas phycosphaerae]